MYVRSYVHTCPIIKHTLLIDTRLRTCQISASYVRSKNNPSSWYINLMTVHVFLLFQMLEILHCSSFIIFASSYILDALIRN